MEATDQTTVQVRRAIGGDVAAIDWLVSHFYSFVQAQVRLRLRGPRSLPWMVRPIAAMHFGCASKTLAERKGANAAKRKPRGWQGSSI